MSEMQSLLAKREALVAELNAAQRAINAARLASRKPRVQVSVRLTEDAFRDLSEVQAGLQSVTPGKVSQGDAIAYALSVAFTSLRVELPHGAPQRDSSQHNALQPLKD